MGDRENKGALPSDALYLIFPGGWDILNAYIERAPGEPAVLTALNNLDTAINNLHTYGARKFIVFNYIDPARFPWFLNRPTAGVLTASAQAQNRGLAEIVEELGKEPGVEITFVDIFSLNQEMHTDPARFGFTNRTEPCLIDKDSDTVWEGFCEKPEEYIFWDRIHTTTRWHEIIATEAISALENNNAPPSPPSGLR